MQNLWRPDLRLTKAIDGVPAGTMVEALSDVDENGVWTSSGSALDVQLENGSTMIVGHEDVEALA